MPDNRLIYSQIIEAIESHTPCVLASVIYTANSTSATVGDKAIITADGHISGWIGGGCCQTVVKQIAPQVLTDNQPSVIRVCPEKEHVDTMRCYPSHCPSEGTVDIFLEPIANQPSIDLYGNTPTAHSITTYSDELNIPVTWRQYPETYVRSSTPTQASTCTQAQADDHADKHDHNIHIAIIATQGQNDIAALQHALNNNAQHILLIASHKKATALKEKLQTLGACATKVQQIIAPAGIDIGAVSGSEIALSVMANVISLRREQALPASQPELQSELQPKPQSSVPQSTATAHSCCGNS